MNIKELLKNENIFQSRYISPGQITFAEQVVAACEKNYCGQYGTCWTCPPGVGELNEIKEKLNRFGNAFVFTTLNSIEDSFDIEGMNAAREKTMSLLHALCAKLAQKDIAFTALGCSSCNICKKCTYPSAPCRFPEKAVPAVEACGIDVVKLAQDVELNYYNGVNTVTYFCMIFY